MYRDKWLDVYGGGWRVVWWEMYMRMTILASIIVAAEVAILCVYLLDDSFGDVGGVIDAGGKVAAVRPEFLQSPYAYQKG